MGFHRGKFLLDSVLDLKRNLQFIRSDLLIAVGRPEEIIQSACHSFDILNLKIEYLCPDHNVVLMQKEVTFEEMNVERSIRRSILGKGKLELHWGLTLFHLDDLPYEDTLQDFPNSPHPFLERVIHKTHPDIQIEVRNLCEDLQPGSLPLPQESSVCKDLAFVPKLSDLPFHGSVELPNESSSLQRNAILHFKGGETAGLARMRRYIWESESLSHYKVTKHELLGADCSSKLSPWLALGCLSPRKLYREIIMFEKRRRLNNSTVQMKFTLGFRDWTKFVALRYGSKIFAEMGVVGPSVFSKFQWFKDQKVMQRWCIGMTGVPFADANLRELNQTGFISNRGRISVANYLTMELRLDWRYGASHFEQQLIDYDVASNWVNWLIAANVMNERNVFLRILKQSLELDPDGTYIKKWVPELSKLPKKLIHRPWQSSSTVLSQYGVYLGRTYPYPIRSKYFDT